MFYRVVRWLLIIGVRVFFRRIYFSGAERVPGRGPVILVANHSASFLDAIILGVYLKRPLHVFVRADVFRRRLAAFFLRALHLMPTYRIDEGKENLHRNEDTFREAENILARGGMLLIFAEGISRIERNIFPVKKGVARVALQTEAAHNFRLGLKVVPLGINYSHHTEFRKDVMVGIGHASDLDHYAATYATHPQKAVLQLTRQLEAEFEKEVLFVRQEARCQVLENMLNLFRHDYYATDKLTYSNSPLRLSQEKFICKLVDELPEDKFHDLEQALEEYDEELKKLNLSDEAVPHTGPLPGPLLWAAWPLLLPAWLFHIIPLKLSKWICDRTVTRIDFYSSILLGVGTVLMLLWYLAFLCIPLLAHNIWIWMAYAAMPFMGRASLHLVEQSRLYVKRKKWSSLISKKKSVAHGVLRKRNGIKEALLGY